MEDLKSHSLNDATKLETFIKDNLENALKEDKKEVQDILNDYYTMGLVPSMRINDPEGIERIQKGVFYGHTGLIRIMLTATFGEVWHISEEEKGSKFYES